MKEIPLENAWRQGTNTIQCDQDNERELGLAGYMMWKLNTKSAA